jgi:hypothetical protein
MECGVAPLPATTTLDHGAVYAAADQSQGMACTGYIALYRFLPGRDEVRVLAIKHQRELDYPA